MTYPKPKYKPGHKRAGDGYIACNVPGCCLPLETQEERRTELSRVGLLSLEDVPSVPTASPSGAFSGSRS